MKYSNLGGAIVIDAPLTVQGSLVLNTSVVIKQNVAVDVGGTLVIAQSSNLLEINGTPPELDFVFISSIHQASSRFIKIHPARFHSLVPSFQLWLVSCLSVQSLLWLSADLSVVGNLTLPTSALVAVALDASAPRTEAAIAVGGCAALHGDLRITVTTLPPDHAPLTVPIVDALCFDGDSFGRVTVETPDDCVDAEANRAPNSRMITYLISFRPAMGSECQFDSAPYLTGKTFGLFAVILAHFLYSIEELLG